MRLYLKRKYREHMNGETTRDYTIIRDLEFLIVIDFLSLMVQVQRRQIRFMN